jgi:hypothetical protein
MPKFFFHVDDGKLTLDREGTELSGTGEARTTAVEFAGELLRDFDGEFWSNGQQWALHVTDERRKLLFSLHLGAETPSGDITFEPDPDRT